MPSRVWTAVFEVSSPDVSASAESSVAGAGDDDPGHLRVRRELGA